MVECVFSAQLENKDLEDVNFVAVFAVRDVYISGNVLTDPKHFSTLQVGNLQCTLIYMYI